MTACAQRYKLVWFVPAAAADVTREAVFAAGAGHIGGYDRCSFVSEGTGTFRGGEGTNPAVGAAGREERVAECRVETIVPAARVAAVVEALVAAHPYEEVAYDLFALAEVAAGGGAA